MSIPTTEPQGLFLARDTGPKVGSNDYTTLVMIHGFLYHSGVFSRMLPLAESHNSRIVLVNRRDYPGAIPYSDEEMRLLSSTMLDTPEAAANIKLFAEARAREVYDFLVHLVKTENIPVDGGIVLAGWSLGAVWMTAFLAYASTFPVGDIDLRRYIRRVVLYDPPYLLIGYPMLRPEPYAPLIDPTLTPEGRLQKFQVWCSGYFKHGDSPAELEQRVYLDDPVPTFLTMTTDEAASVVYLPPGYAGRSEMLFMLSGVQNGLFTYLKDCVLYPSSTPNDWDDVELHCVWCDQSLFDCPMGAWSLRAEVDDAEKIGKKMRKVTFKKMSGANHFLHWEQPEVALKALLQSSIS